ncbi:MAG: cytochrome c oxidase assembly protein [Gaiellaceae bacterium]
MEPAPWAWNPAWLEIAVVLALGGVYAAFQRRHPASAARRIAFTAGIALLLLIFVTPVETIATTYLLSAHLVQNVVVAEWAPALLVLGVPPSLAAVIARVPGVRVLTNPYVALPLWVATYAVWHVPPLYDAALRHQAWLLPVEHACYLVAGLLLWWPVFQSVPRALGSGAKAAYVFAAFLLNSPIGLLLALLPSPVYSFYEAAPRIWELSALRDQQIAGVLMAGAEAILFFGVFAIYFRRFLIEEDRVGADTAAP